MGGGIGRSRPEPGPRADTALGYHGGCDQLLLFGGAAYASLGDTWLWREGGWEAIGGTRGPTPRHGASLAYDASLGELVCFGGIATTGSLRTPLQPLTDSWVWDGRRWAPGPSTLEPLCGIHSLMAFDPGRHQLLLVTQPDDRHRALGDPPPPPGAPRVATWVRQAGTWRRQRPRDAPLADGGLAADWPPGAGSPWPIYQDSPFDAGAGMAFDPVSQRVILYQTRRYDMDGTPDGRFLTWGWAGDTWELLLAEDHRVDTAVSNTTRFDESPRPLLATEPRDTGVVQLDAFGRTWHWDGRRWSRLPVQPPGRRGRAAMALAPTVDAVVVFGGVAAGSGGTHADTWGWDGTAWFLLAGTPRPQVIDQPPSTRPTTGITEAEAIAALRASASPGARAGHVLLVRDGPVRDFWGGGEGPLGLDAWVWGVVVGPVRMPGGGGGPTTALVLLDYRTGECLSTGFPAPAFLVPRGALG